MKTLKKYLRPILLAMVVASILCVPAFATGNVATVVESTWKDAAGQIKTVVNSVVFPALDMILAIALFGKTGLAYFDCASVLVI